MADAESSPHLFTTPADTVARVSKEKTGSRDFQWTLDQQPMYFQWHALNSVKLYRYRSSSQFSFCIKNYVTVSVQLLFHQLWNWKCWNIFRSFPANTRQRYRIEECFFIFFVTLFNNWKLSSFSPYNIFLQAAREINTKREISPKVDLIPSQDFFHSRRNSIFKLVKGLLLFSLSLPQKRFE